MPPPPNIEAIMSISGLPARCGLSPKWISPSAVRPCEKSKREQVAMRRASDTPTHLPHLRRPHPRDLPLVLPDQALPHLCSSTSLRPPLVPDLDFLDRLADASLDVANDELEEVERGEFRDDDLVAGRRSGGRGGERRGGRRVGEGDDAEGWVSGKDEGEEVREEGAGGEDEGRLEVAACEGEASVAGLSTYGRGGAPQGPARSVTTDTALLLRIKLRPFEHDVCERLCRILRRADEQVKRSLVVVALCENA